MSGSPGSVILPAIRSLGIPARCPDLLAFQHAGPREPSPTSALCDSRARTVLTQHCWSCQVLGTHLDFALLSFSPAERSHRIEPLALTGSSSAGRRHFSSLLPSHSKRKKANASTPSPLPAAAQVRAMPWHLPSASDKGDSSQHLQEPWQMKSPFPHPWDEPSDLLLFSSKALHLKYDQKKVQRSPLHQGICYSRQSDFQAPWHVCFQHGCKEKDDQETPVCFL